MLAVGGDGFSALGTGFWGGFGHLTPLLRVGGEALQRLFRKSGEKGAHLVIDVLVVGNLVLTKPEQTLPFRKIDRIKTPISTWQKLLLSWNTATYPVRWLLSKTVLTLIFIFILKY